MVLNPAAWRADHADDGAPGAQRTVTPVLPSTPFQSTTTVTPLVAEAQAAARLAGACHTSSAMAATTAATIAKVALMKRFIGRGDRGCDALRRHHRR
ncbi:hypothetical protein AZH51_04500 [Branchiibius sp. NY16-3462-2]|nr:hypothetical protein AZH51_04500 [Branchiibius sp. NY16-3462-2]